MPPAPSISVTCLVLVGIWGWGLRLRIASTYQALCTHLIKDQGSVCSCALCLQPFSLLQTFCLHASVSHLPKSLSSIHQLGRLTKLYDFMDLHKVNHSYHCGPAPLSNHPCPARLSSRILAIIVVIFQIQNLGLYWSACAFYLMPHASIKPYILLHIDRIHPPKILFQFLLEA